MNQALGEVNSKIIKEARVNSAKVLCFMRDNEVDRKTVLLADCRAVSDLVADCEFKRINSLAEFCSTVFINQNHAECIKQLGRLSKRIDELKG